MIRKSAVAVTAAAALALGTASATSLGSFNSPLFAASNVDLLDCAVPTGDILELLPDIPAVSDDLSGVLVDTLALLELDVTPLTDALVALNDGVGDPCVTNTVLDLVLVDGSGIVLDVLSIDPDGAGLDAVSVNEVIDVVDVAEVRVVLRDATV